MRVVIILAAMAAACGGASSSSAPDASGGSADELTSCGMPVPSTAPATIVLSGTAVDGTFSQGHTVAGAQIAVRSRSSGEALGAGSIASDGTYAVTVTTGGHPVDVEVVIEGSGFVRTTVFPAAPVAASTELPRIALTDSMSLAALGAMPGTATLFVLTHDCQGHSVGNLEIELTPAGDAHVSYPQGSGVGGGLAVATNVAPGDVMVGAHFGNVSYREHAVDADADAVSFVEVGPR